MDLPDLLIIKANENRYVLLSIDSSRNYVKASIIENSKHILSLGEWRSDGIKGRSIQCSFERISRRGPTKYYSSTLCKTNRYIIVNWHEYIYLYTMTYPGITLPSEFYKVCKGLDTNERWHFTAAHPHSTPPIPSAPEYPFHITPSDTNSEESPQKIPIHILRIFIESSIKNKDICPITLEPIVMGKIAMTSCGHLFDKESLLTFLETSSICPQCRRKNRIDNLVFS